MSTTKTIWKYEITANGSQEIQMPVGAQVLSVQIQRLTPCMWALVNPSAMNEVRVFEVYGTGHPIVYDMGVSRVFIGTFQLHGGGLVFHVFENTGV